MRKRTYLSLEALETRCVPTANYWRPGADLLWSNDDNWSLGHNPTASETATFDDAVAGDFGCVMDLADETVYGLLFSGWTKTLDLGTVGQAGSLLVREWADLSNNGDPDQVARIKWEHLDSVLAFGHPDPAYGTMVTLGNFAFTGVRGEFLIGENATVIVDNYANYDTRSQVDWIIAGTVNVAALGDCIDFEAGAGIQVTADGELIVEAPDPALANVVFSTTLDSQGYIDVRGSLVLYGDSQSEDINRIQMATWIADDGFLLINGGIWSFFGGVSETQDTALYMTDGTVFLTNSATLRVAGEYRQVGGDFLTDTTAVKVLAEIVRFNGGTISPGVGGRNHVYFGPLNAEAGVQVHLGSSVTYYADIHAAGGEGSSDRLYGDARFIIQSGASLVVRVDYTGAEELADAHWMLIEDTREAQSQGFNDFTNKTMNSTETLVAPLAQGRYVIRRAPQ